MRLAGQGPLHLLPAGHGGRGHRVDMRHGLVDSAHRRCACICPSMGTGCTPSAPTPTPAPFHPPCPSHAPSDGPRRPDGQQWLKFDDERVEKVTPAKAVQENYGGGPEYRGSGGLPEYRAPPKSANAYMLVYVRQSDWGSVMCSVTEQDISEHVRARLKVGRVGRGGAGRDEVLVRPTYGRAGTAAPAPHRHCLRSRDASPWAACVG